MRKILLLTASLWLFLCGNAIFAQGLAYDFEKPRTELKVADSISRFSISEEYSVKKGSYSSLYEFSKYDALKPKKLEIDKIPSFYARAGVQFPMMPLLDMDYRKMVNENLVFGFDGHHDSFFESVQRRMNNSLGGNLKYVWAEGEFAFWASYDNRHLLFTDAGGNQATHSLGNISLNATICSANEKVNDIYYDFRCRLDNHSNALTAFYESDPLSLRESDLSFAGYVGTTFDIHRIYVDMNIRMASYGSLKDYSTLSVEFSPLYEVKLNRFSGKFGVIFGNRFGMQEAGSTRATDGNLLEAVSSIFPNVDARFEIARRVLWAHLKVDGGYDLNSYSDIASSCPALNPSTPLMVGRHPVDAVLSLETVVSGRLAFNLSARYRLDKNRPYVAPVIEESNVSSLLACHMDLGTFTAGAEAIWKSSSMTIGGDFRYNIYNSPDFEEVTQLPAVTARAYARYNWRQRLVLSVECSYASATSGKEFGLYEIPEKIDLSLEADFALSRHFKIFAKGGNLLNRRMQIMPTINEPGLNLGGGVAVTF